MTPEHLPGDYSSEPRLCDLPRTVWNWPRLALLALIRLYQMTFSRALPLLPILFALWLSGGLQVRRVEGRNQGGLAGPAL
jgi:hypothetical protein